MKKKYIQPIALRVFLVAMVSCATLVLGIIWSGKPDGEILPVYPKIAATLFIIGLASFLLWLVTIILEMREKIEK